MGICDASGLVLILTFVWGQISISGYWNELRRTDRPRSVLGAIIGEACFFMIGKNQVTSCFLEIIERC